MPTRVMVSDQAQLVYPEPQSTIDLQDMGFFCRSCANPLYCQFASLVGVLAALLPVLSPSQNSNDLYDPKTYQ